MTDGEQTALDLSRAEQLNNDASLLISQGNFDVAFRKLSGGLRLVEGREPKRLMKLAEAALVGNLARIFIQRGQVDEAMRFFERQKSLATEVEDSQLLSNAINGLGTCYMNKGLFAEAEKLYQARLEIARRLGDKKGEGNTLNNLAQVYINRREYETAIALLRQRVALVQEIGDQRGQGSSLSNLAHVYEITGHLDAAANSLREAIQVWERINDPRLREAEAALSRLQGYLDGNKVDGSGL